MARWVSDMPASLASFSRSSTRSSLRWFSGLVEVEPVGDAGCPPGRRGRVALAVLAGEPAAGERAPRDDAHPVALAGRQHRRLDATGEDRVRRLLALEALPPAALGDPLRLDDQLRRIGRGAEHAHLALVDEVGQGAERLVHVGRGVGPVGLVQVDVVGAEAAEAVLDLLDDPSARRAALVRVLAHRRHELRRQDDLVPPPLDAPCRRSPRTLPTEYTSAVSMKLIPASRAAWMMRMQSSWSRLPHAPNIMAPRQCRLTWIPVRPRVVRSMPAFWSCRPAGAPRGRRAGVARRTTVSDGDERAADLVDAVAVADDAEVPRGRRRGRPAAYPRSRVIGRRLADRGRRRARHRREVALVGVADRAR